MVWITGTRIGNLHTWEVKNVAFYRHFQLFCTISSHFNKIVIDNEFYDFLDANISSSVCVHQSQNVKLRLAAIATFLN